MIVLRIPLFFTSKKLKGGRTKIMIKVFQYSKGLDH